MGKEIERKFLAGPGPWRECPSSLIRQGYLNSEKERTVRVRSSGDRAWITIKGLTVGATRAEFEYEVPADDAKTMLDTLCERPLIEKRRYILTDDGFRWEIDEFLGHNAGLVVAEIELDSEEAAFPRPTWLGVEVTHDPRYFNSNLAKTPFSTW